MLRGSGERFIEAERGLVKERRQGAKTFSKLLEGAGPEGDMAQLAAWARRFTVEVQVGAGNGENVGAGGRFANKVQHSGETIDLRRA